MNPVDSKWKQQYLKTGSFEHEVSRGNVIGAYPTSSYGRVTTTGAASNVSIQSHDGTVIHVPQSIQMSIVSTSASDSAAGTGIRTVVMEYLNGDLDLSFEIITLNGTTPVNTLATDIRWVQCIHMATSGTGGKAAGTITLTSGGNTYSQINAGERTCLSSFRRVPRNKTMYVHSMYAGSSSGTAAASVIVQLVTSQIDGLDQQETGFVYPQAGIALQDSSTGLSLDMPLPIGAGHLVGFTVSTDKGAIVTAGLVGWVE